MLYFAASCYNNHYPIFIFSRYHIPSDGWEVVSPAVNSSKGPSGRYGHSIIAHNVSAAIV